MVILIVWVCSRSVVMESSDDDDRVVRRCPPVASVALVGTDFLSPERLPVLLDHLVHEGRLTESSLVEMIEKVTGLMTHEPNIVRLNDPVTIVGDLHGQFYDLVHIFSIAGGSLPERAFLFLGDYVDRGSFSVEILTYLFAIKLVYPDRVVVVRGNHESKDMNIFFNFKNECLYKYNQTVYDKFISSFYAMPIGAIVNDQYLCMHGGISPSLHTLSQLLVIDRFTEPPLDGLFCDILWSDPDHVTEGTLPFRPNNARGCSYFFSHEAACKFLQDNGLKCIIRAHEVQLDGFKMGPVRPETNLPAVITVFSAPNYCDQYGNKGAILNIINNSIDIVQFDATLHPFTLPGFMNVFDWSIPFLAEKITELLHAIVHVDPQEELLLSPKS